MFYRTPPSEARWKWPERQHAAELEAFSEFHNRREFNPYLQLELADGIREVGRKL